MKQTSNIEISNLCVKYGDKQILDDINLSLPTGKLICLCGPNGAGKSTFIKALLNLIPATKTITIDNLPFSPFTQKIGYVPQKEQVNWQFPATVKDVVSMGVYQKLGWFKRISKKEEKIINDAMNQVNIAELATTPIADLSGGQQQRVFLARMLAQQADFYFLDEPFTGIDKKSEELIVKVLKQLREQGKTIVIVHHDLNTAEKYFDYLVLINRRIIAAGDIKSTFTSENIELTYE